ncbi:hypothetical protein J437_LFUL013963 [Ladona fulva]|uniref:G-protein coupled receptors family 1 profile domain-containing protein n=1 Tax=Ladona fulva TaxID=123851 RepID=A0A8K0K9R4_LADFU|nr:hypothetical protein J437_LFUL013963 [Ladona fulva]
MEERENGEFHTFVVEPIDVLYSCKKKFLWRCNRPYITGVPNSFSLRFRYIAVTQPIKYAKHKSQRRVWLTIALVWVISAAIGSPIVLGLNNTANRRPDLCVFYNSDFIIYSSLSSFYIPCIIMVFLYYNIFKRPRDVGLLTGANE